MIIDPISGISLRSESGNDSRLGPLQRTDGVPKPFQHNNFVLEPPMHGSPE